MMLVLLLAVSVLGSPLDPAVTPAEDAGTKAVEEPGANREEKLFSVFQIVKFNNDACEAVDGNIGTCYTAAECTSKGGEGRGNCASGFGACCVSVVDACLDNPTVALNNSYLVNPGFPGNLDTTAACASTARKRSNAAPRIFFPTAATTTTTMATTTAVTFPKTYMYTINKASSSVVQIRLDFLDFDIAGPVNGDCTNETLSITGADVVTTKILPTNLCGKLTGQHVYLSVKDVTEVKIEIVLTGAGTQSWNILVRQFEDSQTDLLAPRGCLQYFTEDAGQFSTFNHDSGAGELLNNHQYTTCLSQNDLYCDVSLSAQTTFDLAGTTGMCDDRVAFGTSSYCGSTFANMGTLIWNYTGSYNIPFFSDADNTNMNSGYEISFVKLPCA
jgi:hypothetical protein